MVWMLEERRTRRSSERRVALRYQLERAREQGSLPAVVLADDAGLAVESAGDAAMAAELAAMAPLMSISPFGIPLSPLLQGLEVVVRPLAFHGQTLYLATIGGNMARDAILASSMAGVKRILAAN